MSADVMNYDSQNVECQ